MIKDLVVHLSAAGQPDAAGAFAISIAEAFGAHVSGVAFSYEPVIPPTIMGTIPASLIDRLWSSEQVGGRWRRNVSTSVLSKNVPPRPR